MLVDHSSVWFVEGGVVSLKGKQTASGKVMKFSLAQIESTEFDNLVFRPWSA